MAWQVYVAKFLDLGFGKLFYFSNSKYFVQQSDLVFLQSCSPSYASQMTNSASMQLSLKDTMPFSHCSSWESS